MSNDSSSNSFFSLVMNQESSDKPKTNGSTRQADAKPDAVTDATTANAEAEQAHTTVEQTDTTNTPENSPEDSVMPHEARRVLVHLMRQGTVIASQKPKLFTLLCRYELPIRKHLSEVYLRLVLDQKAGVAFVASMSSEQDTYAETTDAQVQQEGAETEDELAIDEVATLIPARALSLYDTLILLVLRKHYQDRESAGEQKITIYIERLESYLTPFLPITDHSAKDRKKLLARVKEMTKRKLLASIRGVEDRYEITPLIRYVVSANFLEAMLDEYNRLAQQASPDANLSLNTDAHSHTGGGSDNG